MSKNEKSDNLTPEVRSKAEIARRSVEVRRKLEDISRRRTPVDINQDSQDNTKPSTPGTRLVKGSQY